MAPKIDEDEIKDKLEHALFHSQLERMELTLKLTLEKVESIHNSINNHAGVISRLDKLENWKSAINKFVLFISTTTAVAVIGSIVKYIFFK